MHMHSCGWLVNIHLEVVYLGSWSTFLALWYQFIALCPPTECICMSLCKVIALVKVAWFTVASFTQRIVMSYIQHSYILAPIYMYTGTL